MLLSGGIMERKNKIILFVLLAAYVLYGITFINKSYLEWEGQKYFYLLDDAMISMKYAKNIAQGAGPVWNAGGERVEGFTNPLWTGVMVIPHLLKLNPNNASLFMQYLALILLALNAYFVFLAGLRIFNNQGIYAAGAALLTAFYFPLNRWGLMGMEVSLIILLMTIAVYYAAMALDEGRFTAVPYVMGIILIYTRIDAVLFLAVITAYMGLSRGQDRKKHIIYGAVSLAAALIPQTVFRLIYYGDVLPNTYYLKMTGYPVFWRFMTGLLTYLKNTFYFGWFIFLIAALGVYGNKSHLLKLGIIVFISQSAYSIYVGGDIAEGYGGFNRFYVIAVQFLFLAALAGVKEIRERLIPQGALKTAAVTAAVFLVMLLSSNSFHGPKALKQFVTFGLGSDREIFGNPVERALIINDIAKKEAIVAVTSAGVTPYLINSDCTDILGKSDRYIAHLRAKQPPQNTGFTAKALFFEPGHLKWDYEYSIIGKKPDIIAGLWYDAYIINDFISENYLEIKEGFFILKNSEKIDYERVKSFSKN